MLHYIIDGSNLLYFSGYVDDCDGDVILAREELTRAVAAAIEETEASGKPAKMTLVYDVHSWVGPADERSGELRISYAVGPKDSQPADREILSLIERGAHGPDELVLVTDDGSLRREAMYFGCRLVGCEKFWNDFGLNYR